MYFKQAKNNQHNLIKLCICVKLYFVSLIFSANRFKDRESFVRHKSTLLKKNIQRSQLQLDPTSVLIMI